MIAAGGKYPTYGHRHVVFGVYRADPSPARIVKGIHVQCMMPPCEHRLRCAARIVALRRTKWGIILPGMVGRDARRFKMRNDITKATRATASGLVHGTGTAVGQAVDKLIEHAAFIGATRAGCHMRGSRVAAAVDPGKLTAGYAIDGTACRVGQRCSGRRRWRARRARDELHVVDVDGVCGDGTGIILKIETIKAGIR